MICEYGCGKEATHQFKNDKWCCSKNHIMCPVVKEKVRKNMTGNNNPSYGSICSDKTKEKIRQTLKGKMCGMSNPFYGKKHTKESKYKMSKSLKWSIEDYKTAHPLFFKVEDVREDSETGTFQVHCKNHNCQNSKEKGGWFTPTQTQLSERLRALENPSGMTENNFYCSEKCKNECPLYKIRKDPFREETISSYTPSELQTFRKFVLERDNYICQFCGELATIVHHERPQKLEPFFALDPDFAWSCCEKCHYEKGHKDECSTGILAAKICY